MAWTFVDSLNKLSSLLADGNSTTDDMFPLAIRKKELNRGEWQLAVDSKDLLGYQSGTVDSTLTITVPSDWVETYVFIINNVVITNDREISLVDWEKYNTWAGNPPYYYFWTDGAGTMNINLIGAAAEGNLYKLYYFKKPTSELSANTDVSLHEEQFREASAYYAASELFRQLGKNQQADEYRMIYEANVIKAKTWSEARFIRREYARPDFGLSDTSNNDRQGSGYYS